jgi:adenylate cyclase
LFGDTVNVASRRESTGIARKIQVSQKYCQFVKGSRLLLRQDPIEAKGKGTMTTHWLLHSHATSESLYGEESGSTLPLASGNEVK